MSTLTHQINKRIHFVRTLFGCSQEIMGHIIGVTGRTVARWEADETDPHFLAKQKVQELQNILDKMEGVIKPGKETEWFNTPSEALGNKTPLEVIEQGPAGVQEVLRLLGRLEWGIAT